MLVAKSTVTFHRSKAFKATNEEGILSMTTRDLLGSLLSGSILAGLLLWSGGIWTNSQAQPAAKPSSAIPDFSSNGKTWVLSSGTAYLKVPGDTGPGPIMDKNFPGAAFDQQRGGARAQNRIADTSNPILKPWAKKLMDIANARVTAGGIPFVDDSRCWLGGVPSMLLFPGAADFHECATQQKSRLFLDRRIGRPLRKWRYARRRYRGIGRSGPPGPLP